jgi:hypothetical protein
MESSETLDEVTAVTVLRFEEFFRAEHVRLARALYLLTGSAAEADETGITIQLYQPIGRPQYATAAAD